MLILTSYPIVSVTQLEALAESGVTKVRINPMTAEHLVADVPLSKKMVALKSFEDSLGTIAGQPFTIEIDGVPALIPFLSKKLTDFDHAIHICMGQ